MIGAIIGDIVGSRFEWDNYRAKDFDFMPEECFFTDDSVMTIAVGEAIRASWGDVSALPKETVKAMQEIGRPYPHCGYGGSFYSWVYTDHPEPYNSFGNGAAMRVSACWEAASTLAEAKTFSRLVTGVSHNHPEGLKGAEATVAAAFMARQGAPLSEIRRMVEEKYYTLDFTIDEIRGTYEFNETCQDTVPQAIEAFLESKDFEDAIRIAISVGGDSDTLAAITGTMAEAYYGVPKNLRERAMEFLDKRLTERLLDFEEFLRRQG